MEPTCNVFKQKCELHIPTGYERCYHCGGRGCIITSASFKQRHITVVKCPTCEGTGITDWVTSARKIKLHIDYFSNKTRINFRCGGSKGCKMIKRWARIIMAENEPPEMYERTFYKRSK